MDEKSPEIKFDTQTPPTNLASNLTRLGAYLIDNLAALITGVIAGALLGVNAGSTFFLMVSAIYFAYFHSKEGQTPGMKLLGIKIMNENGTLMDGITAFIRFFAFNVLSLVTLGINYLIPLFSSKRQALHDMIFKTIYTIEDSKKTERDKYVVGCWCCSGCFGIPLLIAILVIIGVISEEALKNVPGSEFIPNQITTTPNLSQEPQVVETPQVINNQMDMITTTRLQESYNFLKELTVNIVSFNNSKNTCLTNSLSRTIGGGITDLDSYCTCESKINARNSLNKKGFGSGDISNLNAINQYCAVYTTAMAPLNLKPYGVLDSLLTHESTKNYLTTLRNTDSALNQAYQSCVAVVDMRVIDKSNTNRLNYCTCEAKIMSATNLTDNEKTDNYLRYCTVYVK